VESRYFCLTRGGVISQKYLFVEHKISPELKDNYCLNFITLNRSVSQRLQINVFVI